MWILKYEKQLENDVHLRFGVGCRLAEICFVNSETKVLLLGAGK
jgi:hypothetical protein